MSLGEGTKAEGEGSGQVSLPRLGFLVTAPLARDNRMGVKDPVTLWDTDCLLYVLNWAISKDWNVKELIKTPVPFQSAVSERAETRFSCLISRPACLPVSWAFAKISSYYLPNMEPGPAPIDTGLAAASPSHAAMRPGAPADLRPQPPGEAGASRAPSQGLWASSARPAEGRGQPCLVR